MTGRYGNGYRNCPLCGRSVGQARSGGRPDADGPRRREGEPTRLRGFNRIAPTLLAVVMQRMPRRRAIKPMAEQARAPVRLE